MQTDPMPSGATDFQARVLRDIANRCRQGLTTIQDAEALEALARVLEDKKLIQNQVA